MRHLMSALNFVHKCNANTVLIFSDDLKMAKNIFVLSELTLILDGSGSHCTYYMKVGVVCNAPQAVTPVTIFSACSADK